MGCKSLERSPLALNFLVPIYTPGGSKPECSIHRRGTNHESTAPPQADAVSNAFCQEQTVYAKKRVWTPAFKYNIWDFSNHSQRMYGRND